MFQDMNRDLFYTFSTFFHVWNNLQFILDTLCSRGEQVSRGTPPVQELSTSLEKVVVGWVWGWRKSSRKRVVIRFHYSLHLVTSMLAVTHKFTSLCGAGILHLVDQGWTRRGREMGNFFSLTTAGEFDTRPRKRERERKRDPDFNEIFIVAV